MKLLYTSLLAAALTGCATQTRTVTYADGSKEDESTTAVLQTIQGYDSEGVGLDGTTYKTTIQNLTGDVQMAQVLSSAFVNLAMLFAAQNNTNLWPIIATNMTAQARSPMMMRQRLLHTSTEPAPSVRARAANAKPKKHRFLFF